MTPVTTSQEPERKLAEALRARASGAAVHPGTARPAPRVAAPRPAPSGVGPALLIALLGGAVLGMALALLSLFAPGVLPAL